MRHTLELAADRKLVRIVYQGPVSVDEIERLFNRMVSLPGWRPDFARLIVYDQGEFGDIGVDEAERMFQVVTALRRTHFGEAIPPTAHVCSDAIKRVFVKTWLVTVTRVTVEDADLFWSEVEALAWLDKVRGD